MASEVDALLERLVAQFASPYDFLRELVQNAMDAGADRVEVTLETHAANADGDKVVFELAVIDTGNGMGEAVIDGELTRLFSSSKEGDRSMAGGFGIGFVSVFAWEPDRVLLQTGRAGEAWELLFHADRRFEKAPVDQPLEGTAVHMFRRGAAAERPAIAEAVRDALWRWCRFAPLEVTFEDMDADDGPELIQDAPEPDESELALAWSEGDTTIELAFDVPSHAVLLRHGLVLEEGGPNQLFPRLAEAAPDSLRHLRIRADSPRLRTTMARDKVVDDDGRAIVEGQALERLKELRVVLVQRLVGLVSSEGEWDRARHHHYAYLHAHLALERGSLPAELAGATILRQLGSNPGVSPPRLARRAALGVCLRSPPGLLGPVATLAAQLRVPVLVADAGDEPWLLPLLSPHGLRVAAPRTGASRAEAARDAEALTDDCRRIARAARLPVDDVRIGAFVDAADPRAPLWGLQIAATEGQAIVAMDLDWNGEGPAPVVWINRDHPAVTAAMRLRTDEPRLAALALTLALGRAVGGEPDRVAEAAAELMEARS